MRPIRPGSAGARFMGALLEGGQSGVKMGLSIIPGVLTICTVVMMLTNGPGADGTYTGAAYEGIALLLEDRVVAVTLGSRISSDTFDIHFEKAREDVDGAYAAINCEFARYLRAKYPDVKFLNREDDMGLEGLRKAKLSYFPHHMVEKSWAYLTEDIYED